MKIIYDGVKTELLPPVDGEETTLGLKREN
jgi:hypothetical protein